VRSVPDHINIASKNTNYGAKVADNHGGIANVIDAKCGVAQLSGAGHAAASPAVASMLM
jgi:hypothetical protein